MGRVKGSAVTSRVRYVREHGGDEALEEVRRALSPASRARLEQGVLPHAWVPYELFLDLNVVADRVLGRGDLALCRVMGAYGARVNLPTVYRIFLRFGSVPWMLRKASRLWSVHYDSGSLTLEHLEEGAGVQTGELVIRDFDRPHRAHCLSVLGWAEGAGEIAGATVTEAVETSCRTEGADECRLRLRWRP